MFPVPARNVPKAMTRAGAWTASSAGRDAQERGQRRADEQRAPEMHAQREEAAGERADREPEQDHGEREGAAEVLLRDDGGEHSEDRREHVPERRRRRRSTRPRCARRTRASRRAGRRGTTAAAVRCAPGSRSCARNQALNAKLAASTASAQPGPGDRDDRAADPEPDEPGDGHREPAQRVRLLQPLGAHRHRRQSGRRGVEERGRRARERLEHGELPDLALCVRTSAAVAPCVPRRTTSAVSITARRGRRSANTPPTSRNVDERHRPRGKDEAEVGRVADQTSTANASATDVNASPSSEISWPVKSRRNSRSRSAPNDSLNASCRGSAGSSGRTPA